MKNRDQLGISKYINKYKLGKSPELKIVASEESFRGKVSYVFALTLTRTLFYELCFCWSFLLKVKHAVLNKI